MTASEGGREERSLREEWAVVAKCVGSEERISRIWAMPALANCRGAGQQPLKGGRRRDAQRTTKSIRGPKVL